MSGQTLHRAAPAWYRSPVSWITVAIGIFGIGVVAYFYYPKAVTFASGAVLAAVELALVGLFGWWVLSRLRPIRSAPRGRALACIAWGMTGAIGLAILANTGQGAFLAGTVGVETASASGWGAALSAPVNEETLKMAGLVLLILTVSGWVRGPMEGFVYGSLIGLGFKLVEDWTYAVNAVVGATGVEPIASVQGTLYARVIFTGLGSHWAMSAVAGAGVGYLVTRRGSTRRTLTGAGLFLLAMLMHGFFDAPVLAGTAGSVVKALALFAITLAVYFTLRHRLRAAAARAGPDGDGALLTRRRRRRAVRRLPPGDARTAAAHAQEGRLDRLEERAYAVA